MGTLSAANEYPLYCKCLPSVLQMTILSPANNYPLSCKWVPSLLQMTTLSAAFQMSTLSAANGYSLQNITFRVVLRRSTANSLYF